MPDFEIDVKKCGWEPKHVTEIGEFASRAFRSEIKFSDIDVVGTDHIERVRVRCDEDIPKFLAIEPKTRFEDKVLKFRVPERIVPSSFVPKKTKILPKGNLWAKFFGECQVSVRVVEFTLKLYDCGHFYMKQALPDSGASPYWVIFEGCWERTEKGIQLEHLFRYSWQVCKTKETMPFALEAVAPNFRTRLAWTGETPEQQLNGQVASIVGEDPVCWIEVVREPDKVERSKARFNDDPDDSGPPLKSSVRERRPTQSAEAGPQVAATVKGKPAGSKQEEVKTEDSVWPMYVGMLLFLALLLVFCWQSYQEKHSPESKDGIW